MRRLRRASTAGPPDAGILFFPVIIFPFVGRTLNNLATTSDIKILTGNFMKLSIVCKKFIFETDFYACNGFNAEKKRTVLKVLFLQSSHALYTHMLDIFISF